MAITRINTNIAALTAQRNLTETGSNLQKSIERLSSGLRINRAADDAAGLSVANRLRTQVEGLNQATANAQDGINLINVAEGALEETTTRLNRVRELAIQAANTGTNDFKARSAIQDEVFQSIDEITRIANTTQFGSNFLLNGDFSIQSTLKEGQDDIGANIDPSTVASNLNSGTSFLNIQKVSDGLSQIIAGDAKGEKQVLSTGISTGTDIAVSAARFALNNLTGQGVTSGGAAAHAVGGNNPTLNGVSIITGDIISFNGVLADGVTAFTGSLSLAASVSTFGTNADASAAATQLLGAINQAIDDAEKALFGVATTASVPTSFRTTVTLAGGSANNANEGRLLLVSDGNFTNQGSIDVGLIRSGNIVTQADGVTRSGSIGIDSALSGVGQIGNSITAITGSTFGTGQFSIDVQDVQTAQQRITENTVVFRDDNGSVLNRGTSLTNTNSSNSIVLNGTFVGGVYTGGTSLRGGDTITLTGTNVDGTTFSGVYTFNSNAGGATGVDSVLNDFQFNSISGLISELNFRTRDYDAAVTGSDDGDQTRFENALFTFTAGGNIRLVDDFAQSDSQTSFTLTFNNGPGSPSSNFTIQDDAELTQEGFAEQATFSINGGPTQRAEAGDVVTLLGPESTQEGVAREQVTFRVGTGFTVGEDKLETTANEFIGRLNGGEAVSFVAGQQDVVFQTPGKVGDPSKFLTVDFDSTVDVTTDGTSSDTGKTILISTVNTALNFQIGAFASQNIQFSLGDLKSDNLGFGRGSGRTVQDIDVTSLTGANQAIGIVDAALDQVNRTRSILGAATNRLQATISNLSVASENLTASESRIRDADIAKETTDFTRNQVLLQAGTSVLAQANFQGQSFLSLLG